MFISLGNKFELESTPRSQAVRTLEHGLLNQPISVIAKTLGHYALGCNTKYTLSRSLGDIVLAFKSVLNSLFLSHKPTVG